MTRLLFHPKNRLFVFLPVNSLENAGTSDQEESRDDPDNFHESYDDINVDHLLNNFQLVCDTRRVKHVPILQVNCLNFRFC